MAKLKIIKLLCPECGWQNVKRFKCVKCGRRIQPKNQVEFLDDYGGHMLCSYCPPRPRDMSPVTFYKKYGLVDKQFCNGISYEDLTNILNGEDWQNA